MPGYLIDANLPRWFKPWSGPEYQFVDDLGPNWSDTQIWQFAQTHDLTIVSKDADFSHRAMASRTGTPVIHIRTGNLTMREFHQIVAPIWGAACRLSRSSRLVQIYRDGIETVDLE